MALDDRRAQKVGALVLLAGALAAAALIVLDGADTRRMLRVQIDMDHAGPLSEGDPVIVAGRDIGRIRSISLAPGARADGGATLHVGIERRYRDWISINSEFFLERRGVFGRPYIAIGPPPVPEPWERPIRDGDRVRGVDPARLDRVLRRATAGAVRVRAIAAETEPAVRKLADELARLGDELRAAEPEPGAYERLGQRLSSAGSELGALADALAPVRRPPAEATGALLARAATAMERTRGELAAVAASLERARDRIPEGALDRLRQAVADARASLAGIEEVARTAGELLDAVEQGRGTIGAIMNDSSFSQDAKRVGRELMRHPWRFLGQPPER